MKEYLLSDRCAEGPVGRYSVRLPEAHAALACSLLQYLLAVNDGEPLSFENARDFKAMGYASLNWYRYAKRAQDMSGVVSTSLELLIRSRGSFANWLAFYAPNSKQNPHGYRASTVDDRHIWQAEPLYWACLENLTGTVKELISKSSVNIDAEGAIYDRAITIAAIMGNATIVDLLIAAGADVNGVVEEDPDPPLTQALEYDCFEIADA